MSSILIQKVREFINYPAPFPIFFKQFEIMLRTCLIISAEVKSGVSPSSLKKETNNVNTKLHQINKQMKSITMNNLFILLSVTFRPTPIVQCEINN